MKTLLLVFALVCLTAAAPAEDPVSPDSVEISKKEEPVVPEEKVEKLEVVGELEEDVELKAQEEALMQGEGVMMQKQEMTERQEELPQEVSSGPSNEGMDVHMTEEEPQSRFMFCPDGWFKHGSRCYMIVNSPMSWHSAQDHCLNMGASLASATNPQEYRFLQQLTSAASQSTVWLGGFYLQGRWRWIDNQGFYYTNWYSQLSVTSYPCIYLRNNNGWSNHNCGSSFRFICSAHPGSC